jgi:O-glycosyl hydrolase
LNRGLSYNNTHQIPVKTKTMQDPCSCFINQKQRQRIFGGFYAYGSKVQQWDFILKHIYKHLYLNLSVTKVDQTQERIRVCADFFYKTLSITQKWVTMAEAQQNRHLDFTGSPWKIPTSEAHRNQGDGRISVATYWSLSEGSVSLL